jgi:hypothetical protein
VSSPGFLSSTRSRLLAAALALVVLGVAVLVWAFHRPAGDDPPTSGVAATSSAAPALVSTPSSTPATTSTPSPTPSASGVPSPTTGASATATAKPVLALGESRPKTLRIPELGIDTSLISLGLNADGTVGVPPTPNEVGWYDGSPTPGQLGPATILGHVSWLGTPAEFYKIGTLKRGQTLSITRDDGYVATFTVQGVRSYPKNSFPTAAVYGNLPYAGLRLITCSGPYDASEHYFPNNLVVYAQLTSVHKA